MVCINYCLCINNSCGHGPQSRATRFLEDASGCLQSGGQPTTQEEAKWQGEGKADRQTGGKSKEGKQSRSKGKTQEKSGGQAHKTSNVGSGGEEWRKCNTRTAFTNANISFCNPPARQPMEPQCDYNGDETFLQRCCEIE